MTTDWIPAAMQQYRQFVVWIAVPSRTRPGKTDKMPIDPTTGRAAGHGDPAVRLSADEAAAYVALGVGHGVGFVFTEQDPFFFLDIDNALVAGQWSPLAVELCQRYAPCLIEVSQSGTGLHIIGSTPPLQHGTRNPTAGLELYTTNRFVALTGTGARGDAAAVVDLAPLLAMPGWSGTAVAVESAEWTDGPCAEWSGPTDDLDLIAKMMASKPSMAAVMGSRATLQQLWEGDTSVYAGDASAADAALCSHLAFWTGKDCERMDRLMRMSGLYRDKWGERADYRERTILKAVAQCNKVHSDRPAAPVAAVTATAEGEWRQGAQLMTVPMQVEFFKGCVYVCDQHKILLPDGRLLNPERFRAVMGGYNFALDMSGVKTTKSAWEAFTESQGYNHPKASSACFRPEAAPGAILVEEGLEIVNTYQPIETLRLSGDPAPFLDLTHKLLPDERDHEILLSYLAAMVQYPGYKFQWWPVIQGTEGNGKSAIIRCMAHAVGQRYSHIPNVDDMARNGFKFNSWVMGKLFIGIEEIYVPDRRDFLEAFKTTVTNDRVQIEGKGVNQVMGDNRANGIMCTNHRDGIPVTVDNRRYAIFYTKQQNKEDKLFDGMGGSYFPDLYDWFRSCGYAIVNDYLRTYRIADQFNPARSCQEAPWTSSTAAAVECSLGMVEQEVMEAVAQCRHGFKGGWISSIMLDILLDDKRMAGRMPRGRRREMLQGLGYIMHPALPAGRTNNIVDGGRPVLWVKKGHLTLNLRTCSEVVRAYTEAQTEKGPLVTADLFGGAGTV